MACQYGLKWIETFFSSDVFTPQQNCAPERPPVSHLLDGFDTEAFQALFQDTCGQIA